MRFAFFYFIIYCDIIVGVLFLLSDVCVFFIILMYTIPLIVVLFLYFIIC